MDVGTIAARIRVLYNPLDYNLLKAILRVNEEAFVILDILCLEYIVLGLRRWRLTHDYTLIVLEPSKGY